MKYIDIMYVFYRYLYIFYYIYEINLLVHYLSTSDCESLISRGLYSSQVAISRGHRRITRRGAISNCVPKLRFPVPLLLIQTSLMAQMGKNLPALQETWVGPQGWEDPWRRQWLLTPVFLSGEFHGAWRATVNLWGPRELDTTERF